MVDGPVGLAPPSAGSGRHLLYGAGQSGRAVRLCWRHRPAGAWLEQLSERSGQGFWAARSCGLMGHGAVARRRPPSAMSRDLMGHRPGARFARHGRCRFGSRSSAGAGRAARRGATHCGATRGRGRPANWSSMAVPGSVAFLAGGPRAFPGPCPRANRGTPPTPAGAGENSPTKRYLWDRSPLARACSDGAWPAPRAARGPVRAFRSKPAGPCLPVRACRSTPAGPCLAVGCRARRPRAGDRPRR